MSGTYGLTYNTQFDFCESVIDCMYVDNSETNTDRERSPIIHQVWYCGQRNEFILNGVCGCKRVLAGPGDTTKART